MTRRYGLRIESPRFVARVEVEDGLVVMAAPIVRYVRGWTVGRLVAYAATRRWRLDLLVGDGAPTRLAVGDEP